MQIAKVRRWVQERPWIAMVLFALLLRTLIIFGFGTYEFFLRPATGELVHKLWPKAILEDRFYFGYETGAIARNIVTGHGFSSPFGGSTGPTAWIAPLYPLMCAAVFKVFGLFTTASAIAIYELNSLFGALTCIPLYLMGKRTLGRRIGLYAGWVWAAGLLFTWWPTTWIWDMAASALLLTLLLERTLALADSPSLRGWLCLGFLWGIAALTNPALISALPASLAWPAWRSRRAGLSWTRPLAAACLCFFLTISPWLVRNRMVFGEWVFLRSNAGFEFALANYHFSNGMGWLGKHPSQNHFQWDEYARLGELGYVHAKTADAVKFVRQYPGEFARLTALRTWAFWYGTILEYGAGVSWDEWAYWPLSLISIMGLITVVWRREPGSLLFAATLLLYPLPYYLTAPAVRYRHAIEPLLLLLSSYFVAGAMADAKVRVLSLVRMLSGSLGERRFDGQVEVSGSD